MYLYIPNKRIYFYCVLHFPLVYTDVRNFTSDCFPDGNSGTSNKFSGIWHVSPDFLRRDSGLFLERHRVALFGADVSLESVLRRLLDLHQVLFHRA
jgi:hypothetical protein